MFTKFTLYLVSSILFVSLAGCAAIDPNASKAAGDAQTTPSGIPSEASGEDNYQMLPLITGKVANLKLDASADGTTQQLKTGEVMSITLESNPSTGYSWTANVSDAKVLVLMGEPEYSEPTQSGTPMVGAAGTQTFYVQALSAGRATLTLNYLRSWETDVAPIQTITITVEVQ